MIGIWLASLGHVCGSFPVGFTSPNKTSATPAPSEPGSQATTNASEASIKEVIGKGGETITRIILEASNVTAVNDVNAVKVDLEDDGRVIIYHTDKEVIRKTSEMIKNIVREVEEGKIYNGKVVKVEDFGCFVQLWPGCEGMVHVSQLAHERVDKAGDVVSIKAKSRDSVKIKPVLEANASSPIPAWLDLNRDNLEAKVLALPERDQISTPVEEHLIVELYSK